MTDSADPATKAEQLEVLRRIAERGLALAQTARRVPEGYDENPGTALEQVQQIISDRVHKKHLDLWQHMLDELERVHV